MEISVRAGACVYLNMCERVCLCMCVCVWQGRIAIVCGFHCRMICLGHPSRFLPALVRFQSISGFCLERAAMHWHPGYWRGEGWSLGIQCFSSLIASLPFSIPVVPATAQFRDHCYSFWRSSLRPSAG